jgi:hypothetical protein
MLAPGPAHGMEFRIGLMPPMLQNLPTTMANGRKLRADLTEINVFSTERNHCYIITRARRDLRKR